MEEKHFWMKIKEKYFLSDLNGNIKKSIEEKEFPIDFTGCLVERAIERDGTDIGIYIGYSINGYEERADGPVHVVYRESEEKPGHYVLNRNKSATFILNGKYYWDMELTGNWESDYKVGDLLKPFSPAVISNMILGFFTTAERYYWVHVCQVLRNKETHIKNYLYMAKGITTEIDYNAEEHLKMVNIFEKIYKGVIQKETQNYE